jgi:D-3-phosphoglycerate dehydrogenase
MKILVTTSSFGKYDRTPLEKLEQFGAEVIFNPHGRKLSIRESLGLYRHDIEGVIAGTEEISKEIIEKADSLKVISRCGVGLDNVDLKAAEGRKILVFSSSGGVVQAVAELTLGLILNSLRSVSMMDRAIRQRKWEKIMGTLLKGKTVGILGMGAIGQRVVELLGPFNCRIIAYDLQKNINIISQLKVDYVDCCQLFQDSDIISVHLPYTAQTNHFVDQNKMNLMKQSAFLVNTSRGGIIDEGALCAALKDHKIAGAALDVFDQEPYHGPFSKVNNIILTAHAGSYAREARIAMEVEAVENLIKGLSTPVKK